MLKISIDTTTEWTAGQHIYLRFLTQGFHALTAHPFTICSLNGASENGRNQMVFYVKTLGGLTARLGKLAEKIPGVSVPVLLDGPYGGMQNRWFRGFDHTVLIGGGAGAGFTLALAEHFLTQSQRRPTRSGKMTLVVSSRDPGLRQWYLEALAHKIAKLEKDDTSAVQGASLSVRIHETGSFEPGTEDSERSSVPDKAATTQEKTSESSYGGPKAVNPEVFQGRPDLPTLCREAVASEGSVGLVVCGPGSMVHDVGRVAASAQGKIIKGGAGASEVFFHKESFS